MVESEDEINTFVKWKKIGLLIVNQSFISSEKYVENNGIQWFRSIGDFINSTYSYRHFGNWNWKWVPYILGLIWTILTHNHPINSWCDHPSVPAWVGNRRRQLVHRWWGWQNVVLKNSLYTSQSSKILSQLLYWRPSDH